MNIKNVDKEEFVKAVLESRSIAEVQRKMNTKTFLRTKRIIKLYNCDTSHFHGKIWSKGKTLKARVPLQDYLNNKIRIQSSKLKVKLFDSGLKKQECECCQLTVWMNKPIPLDLHHKDRNHFNNNLDNLQILCANCHAQQHQGKKSILQPKALPDQVFLDLIPKCKNIRSVLTALGLGAAGQNYTRVKMIIAKYDLRFKDGRCGEN